MRTIEIFFHGSGDRVRWEFLILPQMELMLHRAEWVNPHSATLRMGWLFCFVIIRVNWAN